MVFIKLARRHGKLVGYLAFLGLLAMASAASAANLPQTALATVPISAFAPLSGPARAVSFTSVGNGFAFRTVIRTRIYITRTRKQVVPWAFLLSRGERNALTPVDFGRSALVVLSYVGGHFQVTITNAAVGGDTLYLSIRVAPAAILTCQRAIEGVPGCPACIAPRWAWSESNGVYDIAAINQSDLRVVRRVVVSEEQDTPPPVIAIC